MTTDPHQRARDVLAQLSITAEGTSTAWDPVAQLDRPTSGGSGLRTRISQPTAPAGGHAPAESRAPVNLNAVDPRPSGEHAPPKARSLYDHWRWKFEHARDDETLLMYVLNAEEDLAKRRHPGMGRAAASAEVTEGTILSFRGPPAEAAARFKETMDYIRTVRRRNRQDPETGDLWLWPAPSDSRSPYVIERLKEEAREVAREMAAGGASQVRISEATGMPRATLQRVLAEDSRAT